MLFIRYKIIMTTLVMTVNIDDRCPDDDIGHDDNEDIGHEEESHLHFSSC